MIQTLWRIILERVQSWYKTIVLPWAERAGAYLQGFFIAPFFGHVIYFKKIVESWSLIASGARATCGISAGYIA